MAFTAEDVEALRRAIATGALEVRQGTRTIRYRDLDEMLLTLSLMEAAVSPAPKEPSVTFASFTRR